MGPENPVRFIEVFVDELDLPGLGFARATAKATDRPGYHPADLLKHGYLNRVRSSRRLEAETWRNIEVIWLLRHLKPDFKTIADFRRENRVAFRLVFRRFVILCRELGLFGRELLAVDAKPGLIAEQKVSNQVLDMGLLAPTVTAAMETLGVVAIEAVADRGYYKIEDIAACEAAGITVYVPKPVRGVAARDGLFPKGAFRYDLEQDVYVCPGGAMLAPLYEGRLWDNRKFDYCNRQACQDCALKPRCTANTYRRMSRLDNEAVMDRMAPRLAARPEMMDRRREMVEHPFGSIKQWMNQGAFLMHRLENVRGEFSLTALAYNIRRAITLGRRTGIDRRSGSVMA